MCPLLEASTLSSRGGCAASPRVRCENCRQQTSASSSNMSSAHFAQSAARSLPFSCLQAAPPPWIAMPRAIDATRREHDATQHPRFGAVPLRPFMPVGSSDNGLSVAVAAYQAGGRPLISAGSCAEGTCRPLLCPSQARAGRPPLPLPPKKQSAGLPRSASSLSLGKAGGFRTTRPVSRGRLAWESSQPSPIRQHHLPPTA